MNKDPTYCTWEIREVFLCDNYLLECSTDGKKIIGYAQLSGAKIGLKSCFFPFVSQGVQNNPNPNTNYTGIAKKPFPVNYSSSPQSQSNILKNENTKNYTEFDQNYKNTEIENEYGNYDGSVISSLSSTDNSRSNSISTAVTVIAVNDGDNIDDKNNINNINNDNNNNTTRLEGNVLKKENSEIIDMKSIDTSASAHTPITSSEFSSQHTGHTTQNPTQHATHSQQKSPSQSSTNLNKKLFRRNSPKPEFKTVKTITRENSDYTDSEYHENINNNNNNNNYNNSNNSNYNSNNNNRKKLDNNENELIDNCFGIKLSCLSNSSNKENTPRSEFWIRFDEKKEISTQFYQSKLRQQKNNININTTNDKNNTNLATKSPNENENENFDDYSPNIEEIDRENLNISPDLNLNMTVIPDKKEELDGGRLEKLLFVLTHAGGQSVETLYDFSMCGGKGGKGVGSEVGGKNDDWGGKGKTGGGSSGGVGDGNGIGGGGGGETGSTGSPSSLLGKGMHTVLLIFYI